MTPPRAGPLDEPRVVVATPVVIARGGDRRGIQGLRPQSDPRHVARVSGGWKVCPFCAVNTMMISVIIIKNINNERISAKSSLLLRHNQLMHPVSPGSFVVLDFLLRGDGSRSGGWITSALSENPGFRPLVTLRVPDARPAAMRGAGDAVPAATVARRAVGRKGGGLAKATSAWDRPSYLRSNVGRGGDGSRTARGPPHRAVHDDRRPRRSFERNAVSHSGGPRNCEALPRRRPGRSVDRPDDPRRAHRQGRVRRG